MKVKKIETFVFKNDPIHRFENDPPKYVGGRYLLFVLVETSDGIIGLGERPTGGVIPNSEDLKSHVEIIHEISRKYLIGQNPFNIESFWLKAFAERRKMELMQAVNKEREEYREQSSQQGTEQQQQPF